MNSLREKLRSSIWLFLFAFLVTLTTKMPAQINSYVFSQSNGTYVPLSGGTVVGLATEAHPIFQAGKATMINTTYTGVPLPFLFNFNTTYYSAININTNGWVSFAGDTGNTTNVISSPAFKDVIAPFSTDLMGVHATTGDLIAGSSQIMNVANTKSCKIGAAIQGTGIPLGATITSFSANTITLSSAAIGSGTATFLSFATGEIRTDTIGLAPNRIFVIQFKGLSKYSTSASSTNNNTSCEFQIRLHEANGVALDQKVEVIYGNWGRMDGSQTAQVGIRGKVNSDLNCRTSKTDWAATTKAGTAWDLLTWSATVLPKSGLTYAWMPPSVCYTPDALTIPVSSVTKNGASFNWSIPAIYAASGYEWELRTSGMPGSGPTGLAANGIALDTSASTNILEPATQYWLYVRSNCGGSKGNSPWSAGKSFTTLCNIFTFNFNEEFTNGVLPICWTTMNDSANSDPRYFWRFTGAPDNGAAPAINGRPTGTYAWVDGNGGTQTVGNVSLVTPKIDLTGLQAPALSFDYFSNNTFSDVDPTAILKIEINKGSGWINIFSTDTTSLPSWRTKVLELPLGFINATIQVRFSVSKVRYNFYQSILLDSILLKEATNCNAPTNVKHLLIDPTATAMSWTAPVKSTPSKYEWEVRMPGTGPGSGSTGLTASGSTNGAKVTDTVYNLTPTTKYTAFVRSYCGGTEYSDWSELSAFTSMSPIPWTESIIPNNSPLLDWSYSRWNVGAVRGVNGNPGNNIFKRFNATTPDTLRTPNIGIVSATDILKFDHKFANYDFPFASPALGSGSFIVWVSSDDGQTYNAIDSVTNDGNEFWRTSTYSLKALAGRAVRVKITAYRISGDYDLAFDNFYIGPCGYPVVDLGKDTIVCSDGGMNYIINATNTVSDASYLWDDGSKGTTRNVNVSGTYFVTVTSGVCFQSDTIGIKFDAKPTLNLGNDTAICSGALLTLDAQNSGSRFLWDDSSTFQKLDVKVPGLYYVTVEAANGCVATDSLRLTLVPKPLGNIQITDKGNDMFSFTLDNTQFITHFIWDFGDGTTGLGATVEHSYRQSGEYTVKVVLIGICNDTVVMKDILKLEALSVNTSTTDNSFLTLYPNPATSILNILNKQNEELKRIWIFNLLGQQLYHQDMHNSFNKQLDVSYLAPGIYTLRIETDKGVLIRKFEVLK